MKYVYTNSAGAQYALKCSEVRHKVGREIRTRTAYFFTKIVDGEARSEKGEFCDLPEDKEVGEAPNGVPLLRRITAPATVIEGGPGGETSEEAPEEASEETSEETPEETPEETDETGPKDPA